MLVASMTDLEALNEVAGDLSLNKANLVIQI